MTILFLSFFCYKIVIIVTMPTSDETSSDDEGFANPGQQQQDPTPEENTDQPMYQLKNATMRILGT